MKREHDGSDEIIVAAGDIHMKKIMTFMLGLSLVLGSAAFAADEKPATGEKKTAKKKTSKKKTADEKHTEPAK
jgi:hypothetical protein